MNHYEKYMNYIGKSITTLRVGSKGLFEYVNAYGFAEPHLYFKYIGLWLHAYITVCEIDFSSSGYVATFCLDVVKRDNNDEAKSYIASSMVKNYGKVDLIDKLSDPEIESLLWQERYYQKDKKKRMRRNTL